MKKNVLLLTEVILVISFGALRVSLQMQSLVKTVFSVSIALLGIMIFVISELYAKYIEKQTLFKIISIISFFAGNAFYCFAFCFDSKLHSYTFLYNAITIILLFPVIVLYKYRKRL